MKSLGLFLTLFPIAVAGAAETPGQWAGRLWERIAVIAEHHVEAPATQQMVLSTVRAVYRAGVKDVPESLNQTIAETTAPAGFQTILEQAFAAVQEPDRAKAFAFAQTGLLRSLPGECAEVPAKNYRVSEQIAANQYVGIGITLGLENGVPQIGSVFPGGPLSKQNGKAGDQIWTVNGEDVRKRPLEEVIDLLRGPRGSAVEIGLVRKGTATPQQISLIRDVVPIRTLSEVRIVEPGIAYVRVPQLRSSVAHELRKLEAGLKEKGISGLILDLQSTENGRVHDVKLLADELLAGGMIGEVDGQLLEANEDAIFRDLRLAVLVDRRTTGTAEWLAAALQKNGRATLVGDFTPGDSWGYDGFDVKNEDTVLVLPDSVLGLGPGQPLTKFRALDEPVAKGGFNPTQRGPGGYDRWGVQPDVWVGGDFLRDALKSGLEVQEVMIREAANVLRRRTPNLTLR